MENLLKSLQPILHWVYQLHDWVSDFLVKHIFAVKRTLLVLAHLSLFGFLFPEMRKDFGELAANLLIVILFMSPLSKIFRMRLLIQLMMLRRELGIMMGYLATVHGVGYLIDPDWADFIIQPMLAGNFWGDDPRYTFGILAYALTLPLLLTSNALSQRFLGTKWKLLHQSVYLMFAIAIIHRFLVRGAPTFVLFEIALLLGTYGLLKALTWKNFLSPLVSVIHWVSEDYRRFKQPVVPVPVVPPSVVI